MANFNVTIIRPLGYIYSSAFIEAARYIQYYINALGHNVVLTENNICNSSCNIIFGAHLCADQISKNSASFIIFNTEPLPIDINIWGKVRAEAYMNLLKVSNIWDYSSTNIHHNMGLLHYVIPFFACPIFSNKRFVAQSSRRILFYGHVTDRRQSIFKSLLNKGVELEIFVDEFNTTRDKAIASSNAILNIHKYDDIASLESLRCFYPLCMTTPVISEFFFSDPMLNAYSDYMFVSSKNDIAEIALEAMHSSTSFVSKRRAMLERFLASDPREAIAFAIDRSLKGIRARNSN